MGAAMTAIAAGKAGLGAGASAAGGMQNLNEKAMDLGRKNMNAMYDSGSGGDQTQNQGSSGSGPAMDAMGVKPSGSQRKTDS